MSQPIKKLLIVILPGIIIGVVGTMLTIWHNGIQWPQAFGVFIYWVVIGFIMSYIIWKKGWSDAVLLAAFILLNRYLNFILQLPWFGYYNSIFWGCCWLWDWRVDWGVADQKVDPKIASRTVKSLHFLALLLSVAVFISLWFLAPQYTIEMESCKTVILAIIIFRYIRRCYRSPSA